MAFNASKQLKDRVQNEIWVLSGEKVEVKESYKYLGVDVLTKVMDWRTHVQRLISKATRRSKDLTWMCRRDNGLRPRSAMTLWKAMVRPIMEYAAELWAGEVSKELMAKVEKVQTDFARAILGVSKIGVSNDFVRAEAGLETLAARCEKLRIGYWRRINVAKAERALSVVARERMEQVRWGVGNQGKLSWMKGTKMLLRERELEQHWYEPEKCTEISKDQWKDAVYQRVEQWHDRERANRTNGMPSMRVYDAVKHWGIMDPERAAFVGEVGCKGALVFERYLDDTKEKLGGRLKCMCRAQCLPVLRRVSIEARLEGSQATCLMCDTGQDEDIAHLLLRCPAYGQHRERMMRIAAEAYAMDTDRDLGSESEDEVLRVLLGGRTGSRTMEDNIDHAVKRYLKKAWRARKRLTEIVNEEMDRQDIIAFHSGTSDIFGA